MSPVRFRMGGYRLRPVDICHPSRIIRDHELIIVRKGRLSIFEGDRNYHVDPQQFLHLNPDIEHGGLGPYPPGLAFVWLHFDAEPAILNSLPSHGSLVRPHVAADLASRLLDEQDRDDAPAGSCDLLMQLLLLECANSKEPDDTDPHGLAERARIFLRTRHREAISARDVAVHCDCHPDHLGRLFKTRFGRSLGQAIQAERIISAKAQLRDGHMDIEEVARACGFGEAHYFRRVFKRVTGCTPGDWRRQYQRMHVNAR